MVSNVRPGRSSCVSGTGGPGREHGACSARLTRHLLAEVGDDMEMFGTARRLASWAGTSPGNHESAGKSKGGKRRKGNVYLRRILCEVAHAAARTHGVQFGPYKQQSGEAAWRRQGGCGDGAQEDSAHRVRDAP